MNNPDYVVDVAVFTVKEEFVSQLPALRADLRKSLNEFNGFLSLENLSPIGESRTFVDLAKWDTLENVKAVAQAFENGDERFLPLMEAVEELNFMGYFQP